MVQRHKRRVDVRHAGGGLRRWPGRPGHAVHIGHPGGEEVRPAARHHLPRGIHRSRRAARVADETVRREPAFARLFNVRGRDARFHRGDGRGHRTARAAAHGAHDARRGPRGSGQRGAVARGNVGGWPAHANEALRGVDSVRASRGGARAPGVCARVVAFLSPELGRRSGGIRAHAVARVHRRRRTARPRLGVSPPRPKKARRRRWAHAPYRAVHLRRVRGIRADASSRDS